jgi:hypothetical protein
MATTVEADELSTTPYHIINPADLSPVPQAVAD